LASLFAPLMFAGLHNQSPLSTMDELGWESLENKRLKQLATIMYKIHNNLGHRT